MFAFVVVLFYFFVLLLLLVPLGTGIWLGNVLLRPLSLRPPKDLSVRFTLIDIGALMVYLAVILVFLRLVFQLFSAEEEASMLSTMFVFSLVAVVVWRYSSRCLSGRGVFDWKARAAYHLLAVPAAYTLPFFGVLTLYFLAVMQSSLGIVFLIAVLFDYTMVRTAGKWVIKQATAMTPPTPTPLSRLRMFDPFLPDVDPTAPDKTG